MKDVNTTLTNWVCKWKVAKHACTIALQYISSCHPAHVQLPTPSLHHSTIWIWFGHSGVDIDDYYDINHLTCM